MALAVFLRVADHPPRAWASVFRMRFAAILTMADYTDGWILSYGHERLWIHRVEAHRLLIRLLEGIIVITFDRQPTRQRPVTLADRNPSELGRILHLTSFIRIVI